MPASADDLRKKAIAQVLRFRHYPNFPDAAGQQSLVRAFEEACDTEKQVQAVGDYLERTLRFAPLPADVHNAVEAIAETKRYDQEAPSPYDAPGSFYGTLVDGMTEAEAARWRRMADEGKSAQARELAKAMVARYESMHAKQPETKIPPAVAGSKPKRSISRRVH